MRRRDHDDRTVADVLRGFQLLEARHSLDRSRCLSSALLVKSCAYNPAVNALQERCGNHRLRNHDVALSQQLQNGNVVGGVRWTDADSEWLEHGMTRTSKSRMNKAGRTLNSTLTTRRRSQRASVDQRVEFHENDKKNSMEALAP